MRKEVVLFLFLFLIFNISAICNEKQININTASAEDLDKITGIGPARASAIIDSRPFSSVDDLMRVSGIAEITLDKIKTQGLACVSEETNSGESNKEEEEVQEEEKPRIEEKTQEKEVKKEDKAIQQEPVKLNENEVIAEDKQENIQKETIVLTSFDTKDIKSEKNKEKLDKNNYAIYGLIGFFILLLFLFIIKNYKLVKKNEFR
jgi:competence ComEA-like helix-hairpin-helix protein